MLFYPDDVIEKLEKLAKEPADPSDQKQLAERLSRIDPENGVARLMMAALAEAAGDLEEAEQLAREGLDLRPNDFQGYLTLSGILARRIRADPDFDAAPAAPSMPKLGRNEPCWCGSGRKYKKCHLANDEAGIPGPNMLSGPVQ